MFIDPVVTTGYDYFVDSGPNFASVQLPSIGDDLFNLYLWDSGLWKFDSILGAGQQHSFGTSGVDRFRIDGIEASAGLDPNDPAAFVTGLTFVDAGAVSMRMVALTEQTSGVPEPSLLALWV